MAAFTVFLGTLLLSLFVALLAALQLADYFRASEEFVAVLVALTVFVTVAMAVFVIAYSMFRSTAAVGWAAVSLTAVAVAMVLVPSTVERFAARSSNPYTIGVEGLAITVELLVPALIAILVQWGLVRRRLKHECGEEDLTLWPWVTTAVAGFAVLNPFGLSILGSALTPSATDWLRPLWLTVSLTGCGLLVVMVAAECYIRARMLRRRGAFATALPQP